MFGDKKQQQQRPPTRMQLSGALFVVAVLAMYQFHSTNGQFFTKSSKSIPRMGRRSVQPDHSPLAAAPMSAFYRRALIDRLVDQYGPNLLEVLQARASAMENSKEFALRNDQPIEASDLPPTEGSMEQDSGSGDLYHFDSSPSIYQQQQQRRDTSLAMRAFNTDRLLQALSSGHPLMSYERVYSGSSGSAGGANKQENQERQTKFEGDK